MWLLSMQRLFTFCIACLFWICHDFTFCIIEFAVPIILTNADTKSFQANSSVFRRCLLYLRLGVRACGAKFSFGGAVHKIPAKKAFFGVFC